MKITHILISFQFVFTGFHKEQWNQPEQVTSTGSRHFDQDSPPLSDQYHSRKSQTKNAVVGVRTLGKSRHRP